MTLNNYSNRAITYPDTHLVEQIASTFRNQFKSRKSFNLVSPMDRR
jgi:hypothetical protein